MSGKWIWELRTADKHVVNVSESFNTRTDCEADARKKGLQVLAKPARRKQILTIVPVQQAGVSWSIYQDAARLWYWKRGGDEAAACQYAFLTKRECIEDAEKHGYTSDPGQHDEIEAD